MSALDSSLIRKPEGSAAAHFVRLPRVRVAQIVADHLANGWSTEQIAQQYPHLTLEEVTAAWQYHAEHLAEIERELAAEVEVLENSARETPSPLRQKLRAAGRPGGVTPIYLDVHVPCAIAQELRATGVDVMTATEDGSESLDAASLLARSTERGRLLFTQDLQMKAVAESWRRVGRPFAGVVLSHPLRGTLPACVRDLEIIAHAAGAGDWLGQVEPLPLA